MTLSLKHKFTSPKADGPDATRIRPSNWNDEHDIIMETQRILGRITAAAGPVEEIPLGTDLEFNAGALRVNPALRTDITALQNEFTDQRLNGVPLADTNNSHELLLKAGSDLTAQRTLNFITGDQNYNLDLTKGLGSLTFLGVVTSVTNNITFANLGTAYDEFLFIIQEMYTPSSSEIRLRISTDGTTFASLPGYYYSLLTTVGSGSPSSATTGAVTAIVTSSIHGTGVGDSIWGEVRVITKSGAISNAVMSSVCRPATGIFQQSCGMYNTGSRIQGVQFSSNFGPTGRILAYGVRNTLL